MHYVTDDKRQIKKQNKTKRKQKSDFIHLTTTRFFYKIKSVRLFFFYRRKVVLSFSTEMCLRCLE